VAVLVGVIAFVLQNPGDQAFKQDSVTTVGDDEVKVNPLDKLSAADIAVHVARLTRLEEAVAVVNNADSVNAELNRLAPADDKVVSKPQIVSTAQKSIKDLEQYTVQPGDTVQSLASKFGITSESIRWSNDLNSNVLQAGKVLWIPPVTGIVYVVKSGDTADSLARKYRADAHQITSFNDAERAGLVMGSRIVIPNGTVIVTASASSIGSFFAFGTSAIYGFNGYDYGWCTWYVASKIQVPTNWGNANTWDDGARASGWVVSKTPVPGAIAQTNSGGLGHVGIVEAVREGPNGPEIKYSDMNGLAGWGRVGYSDWGPALAKYQWFIYR
jgi:surface antigen